MHERFIPYSTLPYFTALISNFKPQLGGFKWTMTSYVVHDGFAVILNNCFIIQM